METDMNCLNILRVFAGLKITTTHGTGSCVTLAHCLSQFILSLFCSHFSPHASPSVPLSSLFFPLARLMPLSVVHSVLNCSSGSDF